MGGGGGRLPLRPAGSAPASGDHPPAIAAASGGQGHRDGATDPADAPGAGGERRRSLVAPVGCGDRRVRRSPAPGPPRAAGCRLGAGRGRPGSARRALRAAGDRPTGHRVLDHVRDHRPAADVQLPAAVQARRARLSGDDEAGLRHRLPALGGGPDPRPADGPVRGRRGLRPRRGPADRSPRATLEPAGPAAGAGRRSGRAGGRRRAAGSGGAAGRTPAASRRPGSIACCGTRSWSIGGPGARRRWR